MRGWVSVAVVAGVLSLGQVARAEGDEGPITIELRDGGLVRGRLIEFGKRTYRVRVGKNVVEISEREVKRLEFRSPAAKTPTPKPTTLKPSPAPTLYLSSVWPGHSALLQVRGAGGKLQWVSAKVGGPIGETGARLLEARLTPKRQVIKYSWGGQPPRETDDQDSHCEPIRIEPVSGGSPDLAARMKSDRRVTFIAPEQSMFDVVGPLGRAVGLPLVVSKGYAASETTALRLRGLPLRRLFPMLRDLTGLEATPYAGAVYLHEPEEPLWSPSSLPTAGSLAALLKSRWRVDVRGGVAATRVLDLLAERLRFTYATSQGAASLLGVGILRVENASLAELITLLVRNDAHEKTHVRPVWTVKNGVVLIQTTHEAPRLALRATLPVAWSALSPRQAIARLVRRLGIEADLSGLPSDPRPISHRSQGRVSGEEALEAACRLAGVAWRLEGWRIAFTSTASVAEPVYGGSSPEDVFERLRKACAAGDWRAYARLLTRKTQLGRAFYLVVTARDRGMTDPDARRRRAAILAAHGATALTNRDLQQWDNPRRGEALARVRDPLGLYVELATFLEQLGSKPSLPRYLTESLYDVHRHGDWATCVVSRFDPGKGQRKPETLHFYRFGKRWFLHDPAAGIPTRGGEPLKQDTAKPSAGDELKRAAQLHAKGDDEQAMAQVERILKRTPDDARALSLRAVLWGRRNARKALEDLNHALRVDPKARYVYWQRAVVYFWQHRFGDALNDLNRLQALTVPGSKVEPAPYEAFLLRAQCHEARDELARAMIYYTKASELAPPSSPAVGFIQERLKKLEKPEKKKPEEKKPEEKKPEKKKQTPRRVS